MKKLFYMYLMLVIIITGISATIIIKKNVQIKELQQENGKLEQMNIEYRWQLEQVPLIMESVRESWCNNASR